MRCWTKTRPAILSRSSEVTLPLVPDLRRGSFGRWISLPTMVRAKRGMSFIEAIDGERGGRKAAAVVQKASADAIPLNTSLQTIEKVVNDEGQVEGDPLKKKKRSYANAYVRKGEGLQALINQVVAEKHRIMDEATAELANSTPTQSVQPAVGLERQPSSARQIQFADDGTAAVKSELQDVKLGVASGLSAETVAMEHQLLDVAVRAEDPESSPQSELTKAGNPRKRKSRAKARAVVGTEQPVAIKVEETNTGGAETVPKKARKTRAKKTISSALEAGVKLETQGPESGPKKPTTRKAKSKAAPQVDAILKAEPADPADTLTGAASAVMSAEVQAAAINAPKRRQRKKPKIELQGDKPEIVDPATETQTETAEAPAKPKRRRGPDPNAFKIPPPEILEEALKAEIPDRPVPNLGFACLNATLRAQKPPIFTNRGCIKKTFEEKGLDHISELVLENCRAIAGLVEWNHQNGIRFFRMSSCIFPWCSEWDFEQLKDKDAIRDALAFAGNLARAYDQRMTFHPTHFVKLGCEASPLLDKSIKELEQHSLILDLMGYEPSPWNKVNIHIGGNYGDKVATLDRFAENFKRLSPNCQKRLTVENDDRPNSYSLQELLRLHEKTGIPLVFDFHHHRFCPGELTEEEAFKKAVATWPEGVRPVVHWSESQEGRKDSAHSDFVKGPLRLYGLDDQVDVMIEAKGKEQALLRLRDPSYTPGAAALAIVYGPGAPEG